MNAPTNAIRFFATFNFLTPRESGRSMRHILCLSSLRSSSSRGTGRAYGSIMLKKREKMNAQKDGLQLIPTLDFKAEVLESRQPVLVVFWTSWSRSCQVFDLVLQELARDLAGKIKIVKINADDALDLSLYYDIQSIPTLIYFVKGKACVRIVGTATKEAILEKLQGFSPSAPDAGNSQITNQLT